GQLHFQAARDLLELDSTPCESILIVEFYGDVAERLSILQSRKLGLRAKILTDPAQMNLVWSVRKSGLSLLTGCIGPVKPVAFIEDAAVRPAQLPEYVRGLQSIMKPLGLEASYYGHAASGLLHVRPVLDLHSAADLKKFRQVADQTSALVRQFKGSLSAEHGVGIARTEYMREQLGNKLLEVMREIKNTFDPKNIFNPGKIFEVGSARCADRTPQSGVPTRIDNHLRENFTRPLELPFQPVLAFAFKDGSFIGNLEQCNGCGGCLKQTGIMCPTFMATGEEVMSTRGRANIIRAALELRVNGRDPLKSEELDAALSNCLSCKGCTPECPSNVNLALLKAEMMYARQQRDGLPLRERVFSNVDLLGRIGCALPQVANAIVDLRPLRAVMEKTLGVSAKRSLPHYAPKRFDKWFEKRLVGSARCADWTPQRRVPTKKRGKVILWDDTFVRYHEPHIGIAAVKVLGVLGFDVSLAKKRRCCGRPAFSQGELDAALSNCLSCKGCTPECPPNVNLALLKAEMMYARQQRDGLPLRERVFSNVDLLGRIGCALPQVANAIVDLRPLRAVMEKTLGVSAKRSLPHYAPKRFDKWFEKRLVGSARCADWTPQRRVPTKKRGKVILWDDTFVRYHEPHIGIAAVKVLGVLGFDVSLAKKRRCCGRPAFSQGNLDAALKLGKHNVSQLSTLNSQRPAPPILFLEPSCWSMFVEDYRELKIDNADNVAKRCFLFEKFVDDLLAQEPDVLHFKPRPATVAIHPHCHTKSIMNPAFMRRLAERLPGRKATVLDTACCGMAGAFGALAEKYDLSVQVAQRLIDKIDNQPPGTEIIASGTSCRHQIADLTDLYPKHMAELLAEALV
ncbi:MAG: hypothetical protein DMF26_11710, partial [Verrucomicrobia bacterium]